MKISSVEFNNFKPYYGAVTLDLTTSKDKNVLLVGGRNGQGKTSFLVGVVWCLYGKNIAIVDEIYKNEVKGNYPTFLNDSLNWVAKREAKFTFYVKVVFNDVQLSDVFFEHEQKTTEITLIRTYNTDTTKESFDILMDGNPIELSSDETDKINFVNDYLIPIDIAKFVFFDAEKIAEIASLKEKAQAALMDKAFGQILGLDTYESLIQNLKDYERKLKKEASSHEVQLEIKNYEGIRDENFIKITAINEELEEIDEQIDELNVEIRDLTNQLIKRGATFVQVDLDELRQKEVALNEQLKKAGEKFNEVADLIPLAIMAHKLEETLEHVNKEISILNKDITRQTLKSKTKEFAEYLFYKPDLLEPEDDIDPEQKFFYYTKAKNMLLELYSEGDDDDISLDFHHELDKSEVNHLQNVFGLVQGYSKDRFESVFNDFMRCKNDYEQSVKELNIAESALKDEITYDLQEQKNRAEEERDRLVKKCVLQEDERSRLEVRNNEIGSKVSALLSKVKVSKQVEKQLKVVQKYIKTLQVFIKNQKEEKRKTLEGTLLTELQKLLKKTDLVNKVEMNILNNNLGLEVRLYNSSKKKINPSRDMSKGEQQLYISALLKAILSESIYNLPVLIDTPLGRLDQEHRDNILIHYYPELSEQVVIFSTNTEIRVSDLPKIEKHIAKSYRLENLEKKTIIHEGYFN
jgi:DNA sulfur modification protein DndD